jgi:hypothetical protein
MSDLIESRISEIRERLDDFRFGTSYAAWLVERNIDGHAEWLKSSLGPELVWTTEAHTALMHETEDEAHAMIGAMYRSRCMPFARPTEHLFFTAPSDEAKARFIAHAPSDLEALLAERDERYQEGAEDFFVALGRLASAKDVKANGPNPPLTLRSTHAVTLTMNEIMMALAEFLNGAARSAPLDPSSAPSEDFLRGFRDAEEQYQVAVRVLRERIEELERAASG